MIPVCWFEGIAGIDQYSAQFAKEGVQGRSRYACCGILNLAFDSYGDLFQHYSGWEGLPKPTPDYAVIIVHGGHLRFQVDLINERIQQLQGVLIIGIGDEENDFPYHQLWHRNMKLWIQSPVPGKSRADHFPVVGFPCDCQELLIHGQERIYDWSFMGQVSHATREECVASLRQLGGGKLLETKTFYAGAPHAEYFKVLGQTKVVPCPSGPVCSDTFRLAECLEAGCVPVVDEKPGWHPNHPRGIFKMLFPQGCPWPCVEHWSQFPRVLADILNDYDNMAAKCAAFWKNYKAEYYGWLGTDLKSLGVNI